MINKESFRRRSVRSSEYGYRYDDTYEKLLDGTYDIPRICEDIAKMTKSKMVSVTVKKSGKYINIYSTDPKIALCEKNRLRYRALDSQHIIISNDIKKDPRVESKECKCPVKSMCAIPLTSNGKPYGQILMANKLKAYGGRTIEAIKPRLDMLCALIIRMGNKKVAEDHIPRNEQFLSTLSHQLRTPIHNIVTVTSLLGKAINLLPSQSEYVNRIMESCEELLSTVTDSIDYQKIKTGELILNNDLFSLEDLLERVVSLVKHKIDRKNLELKILADPDIPKEIFGDMSRIKQILLNLLINALKYTDEGSISISVQSIADHIQISVQDTGCGIHHMHIERIFEDYYQINPEFDHGMGLGLPLCKQLVELMGGDMTVVSMTQPPTGTRFTFTLPIVEDMNPDELSSENRVLKVLVVAPDENQRVDLRHYLKQWSVDFEATSTFSEARRLLGYNEVFDVVIMDVSVSFSDAQSFLSTLKMKNRSIKSIALNQEVPLSGYDTYISNTDNKSIVYNALIAAKRSKETGKESQKPSELKVCIVEDDDGSAFALREILISFRVLPTNITCVDSGEEAVHLVRHAHFDLLFIDCRLKGDMNGIAATKLIKKHMPYIRAYGVSAELTDDEKMQWLDCGLEGLLIKPFDIDLIQPIIEIN